jgi:hypothetical protein
MAIDVLSEELVHLPQACREPAFRDPETRHPCHVSALYRYVQRGARAVNGQRVKLEVVKTPRGLATSRQAIQRFIERLSDPDANGEINAPTTAARRRAEAAVDRELDEAGIGV